MRIHEGIKLIPGSVSSFTFSSLPVSVPLATSSTPFGLPRTSLRSAGLERVLSSPRSRPAHRRKAKPPPSVKHLTARQFLLLPPTTRIGSRLTTSTVLKPGRSRVPRGPRAAHKLVGRILWYRRIFVGVAPWSVLGIVLPAKLVSFGHGLLEYVLSQRLLLYLLFEACIFTMTWKLHCGSRL